MIRHIKQPSSDAKFMNVLGKYGKKDENYESLIFKLKEKINKQDSFQTLRETNFKGGNKEPV